MYATRSPVSSSMSSRAMPSSLAAAKHASARKRASESSPAGAPSIGLTAFSLIHSSTKLAARLLMKGLWVGHAQLGKAQRVAQVPRRPDNLRTRHVLLPEGRLARRARLEPENEHAGRKTEDRWCYRRATSIRAMAAATKSARGG